EVEDLPCSLTLSYFRAGAGIFLGTFLLGAHFAYRLIFLLFCVPWLTQRIESKRQTLALGRHTALASICLGLWLNPFWSFTLYYVREIVFWGLAATLAWLLGRTLPE